MFGFGRRSEMKEIQSRTESCVRKIERYLEDIKDTLNETIRIAKESELPENNVINQKEYLFLDLGKAQEYFNKINAKLKVEGLYIPDEIAIKDLKIGISECEKMVYSFVFDPAFAGICGLREKFCQWDGGRQPGGGQSILSDDHPGKSERAYGYPGGPDSGCAGAERV